MGRRVAVEEVLNEEDVEEEEDEVGTVAVEKIGGVIVGSVRVGGGGEGAEPLAIALPGIVDLVPICPSSAASPLCIWACRRNQPAPAAGIPPLACRHWASEQSRQWSWEEEEVVDDGVDGSRRGKEEESYFDFFHGEVRRVTALVCVRAEYTSGQTDRPKSNLNFGFGSVSR